MGATTLKLGLGACALFAVTPILTWIYGFFFDDRWRETLGSLAVTLPIGLGVAALVLVVHGLLVNREVTEIMAEDVEEALAAAAVPTPATVSAGVTAGIAGPSPKTATARPERTEAPADDGDVPAKGGKLDGTAGKLQGKAGKLAKRGGQRGIRKIKMRGTSAVRRQVRSRTPRF